MDAEHAWRAIARSLVLLPMGPVLITATGLWLGRRRPRLGRWLIGTGLGLLVALSLPVVANHLARAVEAYPPVDLSRPVVVDADVIVVLGGGMRRPPAPLPPVPGPDTLERLAGGAALARRTGLPLLVSGGTLDAAPPEADAMAAALRDQFGLVVRFVERRSRDTHENALETARLLRPVGMRRVLLVTSAVHMGRAVAEFEAAGLEAIPAPVAGASDSGAELADWLPRAEPLATSYAALYEALGTLVSRLRGIR